MYLPDQQIVAAVQYDPKMLDVQHNMAMAQQMSYEAAIKGAKVIVLPELCMSGYTLRDAREATDVCQEKQGYQTQALYKIAQSQGVYIIFGYVELYDGKLYNSACCVGPGGILGNARKHNLFGSDNLWATASQDISPIFLTPAGRTGILICRDIVNNYRNSYKFYNPDQKFYRQGSVDTLALLTSWGAHYGYPDSSWIELAEEVDCNVIVSNRVGDERDMDYKGGSAVIDRNLKVWTYGSSFTRECIVGGAVIL